MATNEKELLEDLREQEYKYGFTSDIETETIGKGLSEEVVRLISEKKGEPGWMTERRVAAYRHFLTLEPPTWAHLRIPPIDFQDIIYYAAPKAKMALGSMDEVDPELKRTFDRLGIPLEEQMALAGVAVDAVMDSVSVKTTFRETLAEKGIIFCSISEALRDHPDLVRKYLGSVVPYTDNFYAALNAAVFSDGSFCYIPKGVRCPMELSTYFRINAAGTGQFERTLIVADRDARLKDLAYRDLVWVAPDVDQEEVAEEMTKYNLAAIPVCDERRHILGIVTVDDAMEVMNEEHAEDLQIAGVGSGDAGTGESMHVFSWFARRQYWVLVWAVASGIIAAALEWCGVGGSYVVYPMCAMPVVLIASSRVVSFVRNYYLEYDESDGEDKPYFGFFLQTLLLGAVLAAVVFLCGQLVLGAAYPDDALSLVAAPGGPLAVGTVLSGEVMSAWALSMSFACAAAVTFLCCVVSVVYLKVLFWRDEHDLNTSGTAMSVSAVLISCALYSVASALSIFLIAC